MNDIGAVALNTHVAVFAGVRRAISAFARVCVWVCLCQLLPRNCKIRT